MRRLQKEAICISRCNVSVDVISAVIPDNDDVTRTIMCATVFASPDMYLVGICPGIFDKCSTLPL
jgi:hypothetical protein